MIILKRASKFISFILAFIIITSPVLAVSSSAVTYPDGISASEITAVIPKLNSLVKTLLSTTEETKDLKKTVYSSLYKDETLNALFKGIYEALVENADTLSIVGVDLSPAGLSNALKNYPAVSEKVAKCSDINAVIKASANFRWGVTNRNAFKGAVAAMLSPFNSLLNALLCSGKVQINSLISIHGDDGYTNAIVPILKALDCPQIMSSEEFAASASKSYYNIIKNILEMVFLSLDRILDDPVEGLVSTLPKIAYYLDSGKLSASISLLLEPLSVKIAGFINIASVKDLISDISDLENSINVNELLEGLDMSSLLGENVNITLPEINFSELASTVTESDGNFTTDEAASFVVILDFLLETVKLNIDSFGSLMGGDASSLEALKPFLSKSNSEITKILVSLFSITSAPENKFQWTYPTVYTDFVTYTAVYTAEDYALFLDKVDPLLTEFVKESDPEGTIEDTLRKTIYSNSLISTLVIGLFSAIGSEDMAPLFALLGMDITPTGIANAVNQYYPYTSKVLYNYSSWDKVNPSLLSWGFTDGDRDGFVRALTRIFTPLQDILACVLAGKSITLFDAITIPGSDGYNTAIIPLLEALGCAPDTIKTYAEYKATSVSTAVISDILNPITALIDEICKSPVKTVCAILPNIVYNFNNGLLTNVIENILYPVKYMLDTAGLGDLLGDALGEMGNIDLNSMLTDLTSSADLGIVLPPLDLSNVGSLGTATTLQSKRTLSGAPQQYTYVTADTPAVFLTVLRYFVSALTLEENSGLLTGLMSSEGSEPSADGMPDMFAMYAENIGEKFKGMTTDEVIEWLCDLLFSETPMVEIPDEKEEIPTIIYEEKFTLSTTAKIIIVVLLIGAIALVYYILSVSGKLDNLKLKRRKKKEAKRRDEESRKLIKAGGVAVQQLEDTSFKKKKEKTKKPEKVKAPKPEKVKAPKPEKVKTSRKNEPKPYEKPIFPEYTDPLSDEIKAESTEAAPAFVPSEEKASTAYVVSVEETVKAADVISPEEKASASTVVSVEEIIKASSVATAKEESCKAEAMAATEDKPNITEAEEKTAYYPEAVRSYPPVSLIDDIGETPFVIPDNIKIKEKQPLTPKQLKKMLKREEADSIKDQRNARNMLPSEKEAVKLARRQQQAAKKAIKNELKIQKQYEKAIQQAAKKK